MVSLARSGDREAFADLVRRRQSWIRNLLRRLSGDVTLADDLAQQTFLTAYEKLSQLRRSDRFGSWLKQIAVTTWLQQIRGVDLLMEAGDDIETLPETAGGSHIGIDLDSALATLPSPQRLCVVLAYHEGMPHGEIAEATGMPLGTVKSHVRRGAMRLRERLAAYQTPCDSKETS